MPVGGRGSPLRTCQLAKAALAADLLATLWGGGGRASEDFTVAKQQALLRLSAWRLDSTPPLASCFFCFLCS